MKKEYWDVTDEQVMEKTGKEIADWIKILDLFGAAKKKSNEVVAYLPTSNQNLKCLVTGPGP